MSSTIRAGICQTTELAAGTLVVYFYPKDDTPGCTSEASQFRDAFDEFERRGATIVGVSRDSVESHQRFKKKYGIPFALIADTDSTLVRRVRRDRRKDDVRHQA